MGLPAESGVGLFMYIDTPPDSEQRYLRTSAVEKADFDFIACTIAIKTKNSIYIVSNFENLKETKS